MNNKHLRMINENEEQYTGHVQEFNPQADMQSIVACNEMNDQEDIVITHSEDEASTCASINGDKIW